MAKGMTPAKRHAMRKMYEDRDKARKNERLGIKPIKTKKKKSRR